MSCVFLIGSVSSHKRNTLLTGHMFLLTGSTMIVMNSSDIVWLVCFLSRCRKPVTLLPSVEPVWWERLIKLWTVPPRSWVRWTSPIRYVNSPVEVTRLLPSAEIYQWIYRWKPYLCLSLHNVHTYKWWHEFICALLSKQVLIISRNSVTWNNLYENLACVSNILSLEVHIGIACIAFKDQRLELLLSWILKATVITRYWQACYWSRWSTVTEFQQTIALKHWSLSGKSDRWLYNLKKWH